MSFRTQLAVGESGYISPEQLWLVRLPNSKELYVEPRFVSLAEAGRGALRVDHVQGRERLYYAVHLPTAGQFRATHTIRTRPQGMIIVPQIITPGKTPTSKSFRTIPSFYFA